MTKRAEFLLENAYCGVVGLARITDGAWVVGSGLNEIHGEVTEPDYYDEESRWTREDRIALGEYMSNLWRKFASDAKREGSAASTPPKGAWLMTTVLVMREEWERNTPQGRAELFRAKAENVAQSLREEAEAMWGSMVWVEAAKGYVPPDHPLARGEKP